MLFAIFPRFSSVPEVIVVAGWQSRRNLTSSLDRVEMTFNVGTVTLNGEKLLAFCHLAFVVHLHV